MQAELSSADCEETASFANVVYERSIEWRYEVNGKFSISSARADMRLSNEVSICVADPIRRCGGLSFVRSS